MGGYHYDILCLFYLTFNRFWPQEVLPERRKEGFGEKLILEAERWVKEVLRVQEAEFISKRDLYGKPYGKDVKRSEKSLKIDENR